MGAENRVPDASPPRRRSRSICAASCLPASAASAARKAGDMSHTTSRGGLIAMAALYRFSAKKMRFLIARVSTVDLDVLGGMVNAGTLHPLVPRIYPFSEAAGAMRDFQSGRAFGKVVVSIP